MRFLKNQKGFTLIEMLIVMLIITVLIAIAIPNVIKQSSAVDEKGCKAFVHIIRGYYIFLKKLVVPRVSEVCINWLLILVNILSFSIAYKHKKIRDYKAFSFELPTLRKPFINRHYTDEKHFLQSLDIIYLTTRDRFIQEGDKRSFNRTQAVGTPLFVVLVVECLVTRLKSKLDRLSFPLQTKDISSLSHSLLWLMMNRREQPLMVR